MKPSTSRMTVSQPGSPLNLSSLSLASPNKRRSPTKSIHSRSPSKTPHAGQLRRTKSQSVRDGGLGKDVVQPKELVSPSKQTNAGGIQRKKSLKASLFCCSSVLVEGAWAQSMDRFIPSRDNSGSSGTSLSASCNTDQPAQPTSLDDDHTQDLTAALSIDLNRRILSFSSEPPPSSNEHQGLLAAYAKTPKKSSVSVPAGQRRRIATMPTRVLDAPNLLDDYYLNLLDWSPTNTVAIALEHQVYVWNAESGDVSCLVNLNPEDPNGLPGDDYVCSLKFSDDGSYLAVGTSSGPIQIYDVGAAARIRTMSGHLSRVPTLSWSGAVLSSGSRDGAIWNSDVRVAQHKQSEMKGHRAEVCGLTWRQDLAGGLSGGGQGLLASGGNDNVVNVWDGRNPSTPKMTKQNHTAAVKALAWSPWQSSLLASGGGTNDKTIHFWNTTTSARLNSLVTNSQVTSIIFNPHSKEFISSHGLPDNQLTVWAFPSLAKIADITQAHDTRVLHSALSPDGCSIATASSDENLKFWNVFVRPARSKGTGEAQDGRGTKAEEIGGRRTVIR